jgi:2,4-dienoyl-CoA reductase-like NADH-dependent reductase (Old Yellow Enzyme family)
MANLFEAYTVGSLLLKNRFVRSATYEARADRAGRVTPDLLQFYRVLARGDLGAIVTAIMYVRRDGRGGASAVGIDGDELIPGLRQLAEVIKADGSRAIFQLHHAGGQALKRVTGSAPRSPSPDNRSRMMRIMMGRRAPLALAELAPIVGAFAAGARRAREAGADGVQLHAAHGYLLSEFLSPFANRRDDAYGASAENRYRLLGEIIGAIHAEVGRDFPVWVKVNIDDGTPERGMTPELAAYYAGRMAADGVQCVEISAGGTLVAPFVTCRGEEHAEEFASVAPWPFSTVYARTLRASPQPPFLEAYNAEHVAPIKEALGAVPLALVGGMRTLAVMQACHDAGKADLISLSRPLVRQPNLVTKLKADPATVPTCTSCSRCLAGCFHDFPTKCYVNGLPKGKTRP